MACTLPGQPDPGRLYSENCAACHGSSGTGDGPMAAALSPKPSDLTTLTMRNGGIFPRISVMSTIDGYNRATLERASMPRFGDFLEGNLVPVDLGDGVLTPTPVDLLALADYVESLQQK
ncbi:MAG: c-type cytochrome [Litoreibacter sp.]|nr:c-type cytochrome [Litoreibacter sp.]